MDKEKVAQEISNSIMYLLAQLMFDLNEDCKELTHVDDGVPTFTIKFAGLDEALQINISTKWVHITTQTKAMADDEGKD